MFELEVDVRDQACLGVLAALNKCTAQQYETDDRVRLVSHFDMLLGAASFTNSASLTRLQVYAGFPIAF